MDSRKGLLRFRTSKVVLLALSGCLCNQRVFTKKILDKKGVTASLAQAQFLIGFKSTVNIRAAMPTAAQTIKAS